MTQLDPSSDALTRTIRASFWRGARAGLPFNAAVIPFGLLFGVVAADAGFDLLQAMAMSILVLAGASSLTAIELLTQQAPVFIVLLTAAAVNLRMAMYSASLAPHISSGPFWQRAAAAYLMVDHAYALSIVDYEARPDAPVRAKLAYYLGVCLASVPSWFVACFVGALVGTQMPAELGLDYAGVVMFVSLFAPAVRGLPKIAALIVAMSGSLLLAWMPYALGVLVAASIGMATGALVEVALQRRASQKGPST